ncbi:MAG: NAD(P)H-dependent oxidoreductase [Eubacteriales bacterium]|nr:NAD(P)H-dependent oxidoreductase [Eubacteriales bacterium]
MKKLLVINACVLRDQSRTDRLLRTWLDTVNREKEYEIEELILEREHICGLTSETLQQRNALLAAKDVDHTMFRYARQLLKADELAIAAPFWDMGFPASLKCWLEAVSVTGLTFHYLPDGTPEGLCHARKLTYITTAGGYFYERNDGYEYVKMLCNLFGIHQTRLISAEGLDIVGNDVEAILQSTEKEIRYQ